MKSSKYLLASAAAMSMVVTVDAAAQTSVTMYGVVDAAMAYSSNQNGQSNVYQRSGNLTASKIGFMGTEELGGGTKALFLIESGFDSGSGVQDSQGALFNRQSYVGLADARYGTLTMGNQYTPYYQFLGPIGVNNGLTGATGSHPGDIDGLDTTIRIKNSVVYTSPEWKGLQVSLQYGVGEQRDQKDAQNGVNGASSISAAIKYDNGPVHTALGYLKRKNGFYNDGNGGPTSYTFGSFGPINSGYVSAESIEYIGADGRYDLNRDLTLGLVATHVSYDPTQRSLFRDTAIFNTYGVVALYKLTPAIAFNVGYSYTKATKANDIRDAARYQQLSLEQTYALSKRTSLYLIEARQVASGTTLGKGGMGNFVNAVAQVGDSQNTTPSSNGSQNVIMAGIKMSF